MERVELLVQLFQWIYPLAKIDHELGAYPSTTQKCISSPGGFNCGCLLLRYGCVHTSKEFYGILIIFWLLVYLPLWKIWVCQLGLLFAISGNIKIHVPNHQPVFHLKYRMTCPSIFGWANGKLGIACAEKTPPEISNRTWNWFHLRSTSMGIYGSHHSHLNDRGQGCYPYVTEKRTKT